MARVLVVDDDVSVADAIDRTLRRRGLETIVVHSGKEAVAAAKTQDPDLIILDIVMPGMDGIEVCSKLRSDPDTAHLPIIFLTARVMIQDKIVGFEAGADDYLTKPFAIQELELRVRALLRRTQASRAAAALSSQASSVEADESASQDEHAAEDRSALVVGDLRLDRRTFEVDNGQDSVVLTPVEFDLLSHLMEHPDEIFSSERLLQEVWGYPAGTGDPALVRMHIRNLRAKIEPEGADSPVFIRTVIRRGYTIRTS